MSKQRASDDAFQFAGFRLPTYTMVPDELFDQLLVWLSGAELKALLYIIRRTFGFKKDADSISISQMLNGITTHDGTQLDYGAGLSKPTLLQALRSLQEKGIIVTERRRSSARGDEPTVYRLRFAGDPPGKKSIPPVVKKFDQGGGKETRPGAWSKTFTTQETDQQETVLQQTDQTSNVDHSLDHSIRQQPHENVENSSHMAAKGSGGRPSGRRPAKATNQPSPSPSTNGTHRPLTDPTGGRPPLQHDIIYLDNNASTAPDPAVVHALTECLGCDIGNAASHHALGARAAQRVEHARAQVAALAGCHPREVVFTSGATEADNLAVRGLWEATRVDQHSRDTILVGATEHPAVLEAADALKRYSARVVHIPVDCHGVIDLSALRNLADDRTLLISVMAANNETGTVAPLVEVVSIARAVGAFVHSDATQFIGRLPFDFTDLDLDMASLSAHKTHGPKGIGALLVRRDVPLLPLLHGGGHERTLRSGTLNTPGIVGFGTAAELAHALCTSPKRVGTETGQLRDRDGGRPRASLP